MTDYSELIERLENFNPPDRTVDEQRPASQAIFDAAATLREQAGEIDGWKAKWANTEAALDAKNCEAHDLRIEIERLKAEAETLPCGHNKKQCDDSYGACVFCIAVAGMHEFEAECDTLASENAGLRKDAERWQEIEDVRWCITDRNANPAKYYVFIDQKRAAIDAAMEPTSEP